mmetsp:Transcript_20092/g.24761  ORF Transcript_20092/g.24761 Transcript_20092/m.24761 type:complete len:91 (+) Transcript_20092:66-338(+)
MAEERVQQDLVDRVMDKIEEFYFGEGETGGEALFNKFAAEKHSVFEADCDAEGGENKIEYTTVFNEYQALLESHVEKLVSECGCTTEEFF